MAKNTEMKITVELRIVSTLSLFMFAQILQDGRYLQEVSDFGGENCLPPQNPACKLRDTTCLASMGRLHLSDEPLFIVGDVCGGKLSLLELN